MRAWCEAAIVETEDQIQNRYTDYDFSITPFQSPAESSDEGDDSDSSSDSDTDGDSESDSSDGGGEDTTSGKKDSR